MRYSAIDNIKKYISNEKLKNRQIKTEKVNNFIYTIYSFSPYSSDMVAYNDWYAELAVCEKLTMKVAGDKEIQMACETLGLNVTVGCDL